MLHVFLELIQTRVLITPPLVGNCVVICLSVGVSNSPWPFYSGDLFMLRRLWSLTGCAPGTWPSRSPQRRSAADLPVRPVSWLAFPGSLNPKGHRSRSLHTQGGKRWKNVSFQTQGPHISSQATISKVTKVTCEKPIWVCIVFFVFIYSLCGLFSPVTLRVSWLIVSKIQWKWVTFG